MNRLNSQADKLIELYLEIELVINEEPSITKIFPKLFADEEVKKIIPQFCYPHKNIKEKWVEIFCAYCQKCDPIIQFIQFLDQTFPYRASVSPWPMKLVKFWIIISMHGYT